MFHSYRRRVRPSPDGWLLLAACLVAGAVVAGAATLQPASAADGVALPADLLTPMGDCETLAGFQIDGQFYSGPDDDWAQGDAGTGVLADDGSPFLLPALYERDAHWAGNAVDPDHFSGQSNKNNDDISQGSGTEWSWGPGSGPQKNDLTDVEAHARIIGDQVWLMLGANTRAANGDSHLDFEWNQAGLVRTGETSGYIYGEGPDAGRTAYKDFIVSVDFTNGGTVPQIHVRQWQAVAGAFEYVEIFPNDEDVAVCTNGDPDPIPAPPWGAIAPNGDETDVVIPYQFVEMAVNLTALGINPEDLCTSVSTLLFKTRSSASFTAELKDLALYPFSIIEPPTCEITGPEAVCEGEMATLCGPEAPEGTTYSYLWDGPGGPFGDQRCIDVTIEDAGTYLYVLSVTDENTGCVGGPCTFELVVDPLPPCDISGPEFVCEGLPATLCGPEAPEGVVYSYAWDGPDAPYANQRCIEVSHDTEGTYGYSLVVTNETTGCVSQPECQFDLVVTPNPPCDISGPPAVCEGLVATLCGPEPPEGVTYSYAWDGPNGPYPDQRCIEVSHGTAGTYGYSLVVTNVDTDCVSGTCEFDLLVLPPPPCDITGDEAVCENETATLCGPEAPEGIDYSYEWSGPGGPFDDLRCIEVTHAEAGQYHYELVVTNVTTGCVSGTCEFDLTVDPLPPCDISGPEFVCADSTATLCGPEAPEGVDYSYEWSGPGGPYPDARCIDVSHELAGTYDYSLVVTNETTGCVSDPACEFELVVTPNPPCDIEGPERICLGDVATLCGPEAPEGETYSYAWDGPGGPFPNQRCIDVEPEEMGAHVYTLQVTNDETGCQSGICEHEVMVYSLPQCTIEGPDPVCEGDTLTYTAACANLQFDYEWSIEGCAEIVGDTDGSTVTVAVLYDAVPPSTCSFTLHVRVTSNNCEDTFDKTVTVNPLPVCDIEGPDEICADSTAVFMASCGDGDFTYLWTIEGDAEITGADDEATVTVHADSVEAEGSFTLCVEVEAEGCTATFCKIVVVNPNPDCFLTEPNPLPVCESEGNTLMGPDGFAVYHWTLFSTDPGWMITAGEDEQTVTYTAGGGSSEATFTLWVQDGDGCSGECEVTFGCRIVEDEFCTFTQGFYGNEGGYYEGMTTLELIESLITEDSPLVIGKPGRSFTILDGDEDCVINRLPAGGPAQALPSGLGDATMDGSTCQTSPALPVQNGRFRNILLGQTITLSLNTRLDTDLLDLELHLYMITQEDEGSEPDTFMIPQSVLDALDALDLPVTVGGLLELANRGLAGEDTGGASLTDISDAASAINEGFDECRLYVGYSDELVQNGGDEPDSPTGDGRILADAYKLLPGSPNPVRERTTIGFSIPEASSVRLAVYDIQGRRVSLLVDGVRNAGDQSVVWELSRTSWLPAGIYYVRFEASGLESGTRYTGSQKLLVIR